MPTISTINKIINGRVGGKEVYDIIKKMYEILRKTKVYLKKSTHAITYR